MITQAELKELLHYDPETGVFTWKVNRGIRLLRGKKAGTIKPYGYPVVKVKGKDYLGHRLAFLYMVGEIPSGDVDHINGVRDDNRWCNLRKATRQQNAQNAKRRKDSPFGIPGVSLVRGKRWRAVIRVNWKPIHLGYSDNFFEACCLRKAAELKYGFHENHGRKV